jgi:hypothetical protein
MTMTMFGLSAENAKLEILKAKQRGFAARMSGAGRKPRNFLIMELMCDCEGRCKSEADDDDHGDNVCSL